MRSRDSRFLYRILSLACFSLLILLAGCGATLDKGPSTTPAVTIASSTASITAGASSTLTVVAVNATQVKITGTDGSSYSMAATGGTQVVSPAATTTYTVTATGGGGTVTATTTVTVTAQVPTGPPPTVSLAANPASITTGSSSTLTVTAANATLVKITGSDGSSYNLASTGGTQVVSPTATTSYTATATGGGASVTATATVTVTAQTSGSPTVSIAANPASISAGSASTLTVAAANATQVTVTGSDNTTYTLQATGGTQVVSPAATTTYTATATGTGGTTSATAVVTVTAPVANAPTVSITANPASITSGGSTTLTVAATNATQVVISGSDGNTYALQPNGGAQAVSPTSTTTYTASASGNGATATAAATVTVTAPQAQPTVTIAANPTTITAGSSSTLTVATTNATLVMVTGTDGSSYTLQPNGGTQVVSPAASTTYTATATGSPGTTQATTTVALTVVPAPPPPPAATVAITANPTSITAGASSTLTVTATNATQVTLTGSDGTAYTVPPTGGTQLVSPSVTTTYNASATGPGTPTSTPAMASVIVTVTQPATPTVTIAANPASITAGSSSTLTVIATNATQVTVTGTDGSSYTLQPSGGTQTVTPAASATYTATATGNGSSATGTATVTVTAPGSVQSINHVLFMLQENHSFDNYFGELNPYRQAHGYTTGDDGKVYKVDGIDGREATISNQTDGPNSQTFHLFKLATTCVDDMSSSWLESFGDVNRYNFLTTRPIAMDGFVHNAEGFAKTCAASGTCSGQFTDLAGQRAMGYYDEGFLNYDYYMASQFAVSNRWFSPMASKSIPNRIATFTGGTTQGLVLDIGNDDHLPQLVIRTIFEELDNAKVSWKIYYTVTNGGGGATSALPATTFSALSYSYKYLYGNPSHAACTGTTQPSSIVGDSTNSFCIDPNHIAPLTPNYFNDVNGGTLPSFSFIESGSGLNDEHPGSGQSILVGQSEVAHIVNTFMSSPSWKDSVFFYSYDEGGGPYDHVPPVPGHSNQNTDPSLGAIPDILQIAVNPEDPSGNPNYFPCQPGGSTATLHCDLKANYPGDGSNDAPAVRGFGAQLGFRVPNIIISPFTRKHYVGNNPMDHTAVIKFVENRFIGSSAHLTLRDQAQPDLLDFFDFTAVPWATPPTPPAPVTQGTCNAAQLQ